MYQSTQHLPLAHLAHATATGYGEDLLRAALGIDSGMVETTAHARAALAACAPTRRSCSTSADRT